MKLIKLIPLLGLSFGFANAATVSVTQGVGAQGFTVLVNGLAPASFVWAAGNYNTINSTWTQFGGTQTDTGKINGSVSATSPTSLNNSVLNLYVGTAAYGTAGASWVIMNMTNNLAFPADVTLTGGPTFLASVTNGVNFVARSNVNNGFTAPVATAGGSLNLVPEPSAALLGALGALGLLRRRRI